MRLSREPLQKVLFGREHVVPTRVCVGVILFVCFATLTQGAPPTVIDVWIGTSRAKPSQGIYHCLLNTDSGKLSDPILAAEVGAPGFLAMHPRGGHLYAACIIAGKPSVAAYTIQRQQGKASLALLKSVEIGDGGAAHVAVDSTGKTLLTAQYGGGSVAVFSISEDGLIEERTQLMKHDGASGVVPRRQSRSHPHWVGFSPDNRFAFVPDLGMDRVVIYRVAGAVSKITQHGFGVLPPGSGPRHMKFHSSGKWIYVLNELDLSVTVFDYDATAGTMTAKQTILTIPKAQLAHEKFKSASEIRVHPNGRFVFAANRGHDTITAFRVNGDDGQLSVIEHEPIRGATPRNFNIDPSGRWLIAAGQDSHTLASFEVDQQTGSLTYNRSNVFAPSPICVLFVHE